MKNQLKAPLVGAILLGALLSGCGGGSDTPAPVVPVVPPTPVASVTSVAPESAPMFGKAGTFIVTGANLDQGITLVAPTCAGIAEAAGGSATQRTYSCTPSALGAMSVAVQSTAGAALASIAPVIPQPQVTIKTTLGDMVVELYPTNAPITVANFLKYVSANFYDNLIFHRVVANFVIQAGGFNANMQVAAPNAPIKLEVPNGLSNLRGTVAMARTGVLDSATSQFFINTVDNTSLDIAGGGYAVFGKVVTGLTVVDQISVVPTQTVSVFTNVPVTPVVITSLKQTQ